jgi:hypothetical protein
MSSQEIVYDTAATDAPPLVDVDRPPLAVSESARRSGPAAAVILAAGLASFTLGLLSVLTAASAAVSAALTFSDSVGDLSGLTTSAALVFFAAWAALAMRWRHADPSLVRVAVVTSVLIALGLLGTFPPFFNAVGG